MITVIVRMTLSTAPMTGGDKQSDQEVALPPRDQVPGGQEGYPVGKAGDAGGEPQLSLDCHRDRVTGCISRAL